MKIGWSLYSLTASEKQCSKQSKAMDGLSWVFSPWHLAHSSYRPTVRTWISPRPGRAAKRRSGWRSIWANWKCHRLLNLGREPEELSSSLLSHPTRPLSLDSPECPRVHLSRCLDQAHLPRHLHSTAPEKTPIADCLKVGPDAVFMSACCELQLQFTASVLWLNL